YLFWMLVFATTRLVFLIWNKEELSGIPSAEIFSTFIHAIYIDTAMASYLLAPAWLLITTALLTQRSWPLVINRWLTLFFIIIILLVTISELPIYDQWHTKLNYKAIWFLQDPSEVFHTASPGQLFFGTTSVILLTWGFYFLYKRWMEKHDPLQRRPWVFSILFILTIPVLIFTGMRGGFRPIPVQISDAYFSKHNIINLATVNSAFNLCSSWIESAKATEPYSFMPENEANKLFAELHDTPKDSTISILTTDRPNVVLVVLESWSADLVKSCGGYDSITPRFDSLAGEGILFTRCYASGSLSDQGMAAVFSGFPAQPKTSIITQPTKYAKLPCINFNFKNAGYRTSFMFGGQLSYGNIRAYMYYNGFDRIIEEDDFSSSVPKGRLGVPDGPLFTRQLEELKKEQEPFFAAMFTLSSHGPFDYPMKDVLHWGDKEKPFINSVYYADSCIGDFIKGAKKFPWYKNTLFVFVSDHSHNSPRNWAFNQPQYRRIPLLFFGEVIRPEYRGMKYDSIASQSDLAATLLRQLKMDADDYRFSKDLFNPSASRYAYYAFDEGFGLVKPEGQLTWHVKEDRTEFEIINSAAGKNKLLRQGQAFLQELMDAYFAY
ncbi:MAG TPA: sulfatase-like hydrolase/transferase, partial [Bacteroidia bacterium]|nr:sulfatase-like hydrolase/transferase [Bacteroidia bacterium]